MYPSIQPECICNEYSYSIMFIIVLITNGVNFFIKKTTSTDVHLRQNMQIVLQGLANVSHQKVNEKENHPYATRLQAALSVSCFIIIISN